MNPLLKREQNTQVDAQAQMPIDQQPANDPSKMQDGGLSVNSTQIEDGIKKQLQDDQIGKLDRVLAAGNKLLFGKDTHYQIIDSMQGLEGEQLSAAMGDGALALTSVLMEKSGNTLPGDLIAPAVTILMARAAEFVNEAGIANVTDDVLEEALHIFSVKIMDQADPEFRNKIGMNQGQQPEQTQPQVQQQQPVGGV